MFAKDAYQATKNRGENLHKLVYYFGSQTDLANKIIGRSITQPHISLIVNGKRSLYEQEARAIERDLSIPIGWLDIEPWQSQEWRLLEKYLLLDEHGRQAFDELLALFRTKSLQ
ncbi:hypothetical protein [Glaciecola sp. 33A]|uniref:hypothetical protein n=1 Tax=Glaciecola sp. 33A TaxID=2057807 RepID=UPI000C328353|nr:hypothetical protein [Glaciecola sp. 33A]PKI01922.1 hypothetical protein CXF81_09510 [Glaciecola sp. 33A]